MKSLCVHVLSVGLASFSIGAASSRAAPGSARRFRYGIVERATVVDGHVCVVLFNPGSVLAVGWGNQRHRDVPGWLIRVAASCDAHEEFFAPTRPSSVVALGARNELAIGVAVRTPERVAGVTAVPTLAIRAHDRACMSSRPLNASLDVSVGPASTLSLWSTRARPSHGAGNESRSALLPTWSAPSFRSFQHQVAAALRLADLDPVRARMQIDWVRRRVDLTLRAAKAHRSRRL